MTGHRADRALAGDLLSDAMDRILKACTAASEAGDDEEWTRLQALHGVVDYSRRVLVGDSAFYRAEKASLLLDDATRLVEATREQAGW